MAYSELAGSGHFALSSSFESADHFSGSDSTSTGGSVEATLTTTTWSSLFLLGELLQIGLNFFDDAAWSFLVAFHAIIGEAADRCTRVVEHAGAEVLFELVEVALALLDQVGVDRVANFAKLHGFVEERRLADIVSTDDDFIPADQIEAVKGRAGA